MSYYFQDCCCGETTDLRSPMSYHVFEYSNGLVGPDTAQNRLAKNLLSVQSESDPAKHEYYDRDYCLNVSPSAFNGSSVGYNLFDSKQAIINQLMSRMSSIGKERDRAKEENLYQIELDIFKCRNQLLELGLFYVGQNKSVDQRRLALESHLLDLYREKRAEEASSWRDQLWLKRDLIVALKEYLELERRKNLINEIMEYDYSVNQNDDRGTMQKT